MSGNTETPSPAPEVEAPVPPPHQRAQWEINIIVGALVVSLLAVLGFTLLTVVWGYGFPAPIVAFFLGSYAAALAHSVLGGVGGFFQTPAGRLSGSAGAMMIVTGAMTPLLNSLQDVRAVQAGRDAEVRIQAEERKVTEERTARRAAERERDELKGQQGDVETNSMTAIVARIRASSAEQPLGKAVLELFRNGQGPFNRSLRSLRLPVRFNETVRPGTFRYCHDRRSEFHGRPVRFEVVNREAGTSNSITLEPGGDIGQGICSDIAFDVLLGCDAVQSLLPELVAGCESRAGVAWIPPNTNRNYDVVATILNPELVPRTAVGDPQGQ